MIQKQSYVNLSRKYRPKNLSELVGQEVLVRTLSNAIKNNKPSQSYLLCGIRGVGKTTTARIIAKSVNCTNLKENVIACEECANCKNFNQQAHPDILETDAASRTGVDDVRAIIENAEYKPMLGAFKVFIIDEVHMLSKNAFNALLKILEEPPAHCIFIFATTEIHKIPLTIISRCQRFNLRRMDVDTLVNLLDSICIKEGVRAEKRALEMLAFRGDGSARDSLSLLDQAFLISERGLITESIVQTMTGSVDYKITIDLILGILNQDAKSCLAIISNFYQTHSDFHIFTNNLLIITSYIAKKIACPSYVSMEFFSIEEQASSIAGKTDALFLQILWKITYSSILELKHSENQLLNMEMLVLKLIYVIANASGNKKATTAGGEEPKALESSSDDDAQPDKTLDSRPIFEDKKLEASKEARVVNSSSDKIDEIGQIEFDLFLKHLSSTKEMGIFYELFNQSEIVHISLDSILIARVNKDATFEKSVELHLEQWLGRKIDCKFTYKDKIISYKTTIFREAKNNHLISRISKNFAELKMIDIIAASE
ncbi:MAG: DNA polymerase III subunit gamma/tau [Alphaproteobacteria bacterium]|nr:DNA polymerase III subunit gamma/tau [Alphaproteobacteria bacterium]